MQLHLDFISLDRTYVEYMHRFTEQAQIPGVTCSMFVGNVEVRSPDYRCDYHVAPGNGFGELIGGYDLALRNIHGGNIQQRLWERIEMDFFGELPVGAALLLTTNHPLGSLVYAPTMRIPLLLSTATDVPYCATLAALQTILRDARQLGRDRARVLLPAMGGGVGCAPPALVGNQIALAIEMTMRYSRRQIMSLQEARDWERRIYRGHHQSVPNPLLG